MSGQLRGRIIGLRASGGGQLGHTSLYQLQLADGRLLVCDYIEVAADGFKTLREGDEVWCSVSDNDPGWATYVVPIRDYSPRQLLGLQEPAVDGDDPISELWF